MAMSEEERRLLKELELGLIADDPHLAMELLSGYPSRRFRSGLLYGSAVGFLGLALFVAGVSGQATAVGVTGFLLMALGTYLALVKRKGTFNGRGGHGGPR
jgi:VIT1/CCC1 family predicted Fe2+/Mn2+ transporter